MACDQRLADGSYLSHVYPSERDWGHNTNGIAMRSKLAVSSAIPPSEEESPL